MTIEGEWLSPRDAGKFKLTREGDIVKMFQSFDGQTICVFDSPLWPEIAWGTINRARSQSRDVQVSIMDDSDQTVKPLDILAKRGRVKLYPGQSALAASGDFQLKVRSI